MNKAELIAKNAQLRQSIAFEKAQAARYRAALEEIARIAPAKTHFDDAYWTGINDGVAECQVIARRALHPEEEER
jgi:hypothetical protein